MAEIGDARLAQAAPDRTPEEHARAMSDEQAADLRRKLELLIAGNMRDAGHRIETIAAALGLTTEGVQCLLDGRKIP